MAGTSLFALIDDIATILDDVAVMTKVASKKTAAVVGDDLALNANQVTGIRAERELPVVWAVAKGSMINKVILVPLAMVISIFLPAAIKYLLMIGGAYLCFEGVEKLVHKFLHTKAEDANHHKEMVDAIVDEKVDMVAFEKDKIKGAVRTDFILSAEIIVISLGAITALNPPPTRLQQVLVLAAISIGMTVGVYGLVGGIVKLDDAGAVLVKKPSSGAKAFGKAILVGAPMMMKFLSVAGTLAMFLVGGEIVAHGIESIEHLHHAIVDKARAAAGPVVAWFVGTLATLVIGLAVGAILVVVVTGAGKIFKKEEPKDPASLAAASALKKEAAKTPEATSGAKPTDSAS